MRAIELNAVAVNQNKAAFEWGRRAAHDPAAFAALLGPAAQVVQLHVKPSLNQLIQRRVEFLTAYQDSAYAQQYQAFVERVREVEAPLGKTALTEAVARYLFKLMAYKDEYEVARLHTDPAFRAQIAEQFEGDYRLQLHLAPPLFAKTNDKGELIKQTYGPWMLKAMSVLARFKGLRGTALDVFGRTEERRTERELIVQYRADIEGLLAGLNADSHALVLEVARLPEQIRGFGHVKARHLAAVQTRREQLLAQWRESTAGAPRSRAA
jgi:indolepyruvate ferredoxin oxidoreductase